ncbi:hypothetical protein B0H10DRAFT_1963984 [Mycena sp. CBHHK59/15]|nr:hypothetical protein B0H10DRAFT_1963984 [Mycena sp. CBHHK59/15]
MAPNDAKKLSKKKNGSKQLRERRTAIDLLNLVDSPLYQTLSASRLLRVLPPSNPVLDAVDCPRFPSSGVWAVELPDCASPEIVFGATWIPNRLVPGIILIEVNSASTIPQCCFGSWHRKMLSDNDLMRSSITVRLSCGFTHFQ